MKLKQSIYFELGSFMMWISLDITILYDIQFIHVLVRLYFFDIDIIYTNPKLHVQHVHSSIILESTKAHPE